MRASMGFFAAFISIFYLAGFGMLGYGIWSIKRSNEVESWPTTNGRVESCKLVSNADGESTTYKVEVRYRYRVKGRKYAHDKLAFGYTASSGLSAHREILSRLENARSVTVRYDPMDPQTAVLSYGVHRSIQFVIAFAITWILFVVGFTVIWWVASNNDSVLLQNLITP